MCILTSSSGSLRKTSKKCQELFNGHIDTFISFLSNSVCTLMNEYKDAFVNSAVKYCNLIQLFKIS